MWIGNDRVAKGIARGSAAFEERQIGVWTKPLARRTLRISLARSAG